MTKHPVTVIIAGQHFDALLTETMRRVTPEELSTSIDLEFLPKDAERMAEAVKAKPPKEYGMRIVGRNGREYV